MKEKNAVDSINTKLSNNKFVDVDPRGLIGIWFGNPKTVTDDNLFNKLKDFSERNDFGYVLVLGNRKNYLKSIRFWKKEKTKLLKG